MPFLDHGEFKAYYRWEGLADGPVMVLSHSLGCSCEMWRGQVEALGDRFRILLYDHRGHGQSGIPSRPWAIDDFGEDLVRLLNHLGLELVNFCGVSLGGMVGMWVAQNAPGRLARMALCNTSAKTEDPTLLQGRIRLIESEGMAAIVDNVLERWFTEAFRSACPDEIAGARKVLESASADAYAATSRAVCELNLLDELGAIEIPTMVVYGTYDQATPPAWNLAIADAIPGAKAVELPTAHLSNIEARSEFNRVVEEFLVAKAG